MLTPQLYTKAQAIRQASKKDGVTGLSVEPKWCDLENVFGPWHNRLSRTNAMTWKLEQHLDAADLKQQHCIFTDNLESSLVVLQTLLLIGMILPPHHRHTHHRNCCSPASLSLGLRCQQHRMHQMRRLLFLSQLSAAQQ